MARPRKLSDADVGGIRAWAARWRAIPTRKEMATKYGVSEYTIDRIARGGGYVTRYTEKEIEEFARMVTRETNESMKNPRAGQYET